MEYFTSGTARESATASPEGAAPRSPTQFVRRAIYQVGTVSTLGKTIVRLVIHHMYYK